MDALGKVKAWIGGLTEIWLGVDAEKQQLEDVAAPLTAEGGGSSAYER